MTPWSGDGWGQSGGGATPTAPSIAAARTVAANTSDWNVANNGSTSSNNHNLFGTSGYGSSTITVYRDGVLQGTALTASDGTWTFATGVMPDATMAFTATVTVGGVPSVLSPQFTMTVATNIVGFTAVNGSPFTIGSIPVYTATTNAAAAYALTQIDPHTLRWECRQGDRWQYDSVGTGRCEIDTGNGYVQTYYLPIGGLQRMSTEIMWEAGESNDTIGMINYQMHNDDGPTAANQGTSPYWYFGLCGAGGYFTAGNRFYLDCRDWNSSYGASIQNNVHIHSLYVAPSDITRGVYHRFQIECLPGVSGHLYAWMDGVQIANYSGPIGYGYMGYMAFGLYKYDAPNTQSVRHRNYIFLVG